MSKAWKMRVVVGLVLSLIATVSWSGAASAGGPSSSDLDSHPLPNPLYHDIVAVHISGDDDGTANPQLVKVLAPNLMEYVMGHKPYIISTLVTITPTQREVANFVLQGGFGDIRLNTKQSQFSEGIKYAYQSCEDAEGGPGIDVANSCEIVLIVDKDCSDISSYEVLEAARIVQSLGIQMSVIVVGEDDCHQGLFEGVSQSLTNGAFLSTTEMPTIGQLTHILRQAAVLRDVGIPPGKWCDWEIPLGEVAPGIIELGVHTC